MPAFVADLADLATRCSAADLTAHQRGRLLEDLVATAFAAVPGIEVRARNAKSVFENEELDLVMTNRAAPNGLPVFGPYFSVECKNWSAPVGSTEVSWFATKLRRSGQVSGVLVAANGLTGLSSERTAAHFEAASALSEGQAIVVLTLKELMWVADGEQLAELIIEKHARLVAYREVYIDETGPRTAHLPVVARPPSTQVDREAVLRELADAVVAAPDLIRTVEVCIEHVRTALAAFEASEAEEVEASSHSEVEFDRWAERNLIAFEQLQDALARLGRACIARLRSQPGSDWAVDYLALGLETRAPRNLEAPPDSELARLLIDHWCRLIAAGASSQHDAAALSLLSWSIDWLIAMRAGTWPPPLV